MAKKYDREQLLADWKAGGYSQRKLASKHGISLGMVNKLTKGVSKESEQLVSTIVKAQQELEGKAPEEVNAISERVNSLLEGERTIRRLTNANLNGVENKLRKPEDLSMFDHKNAQDLIDKASITLGVNERHSKPTQVSQTTQTLVTDSESIQQRIYEQVMDATQ